MRRLILLIGALAVLGLVTPVADACTCIASHAPCEAYGTATAVFVGTAIRVGDAEPLNKDIEPYSTRLLPFWPCHIDCLPI